MASGLSILRDSGPHGRSVGPKQPALPAWVNDTCALPVARFPIEAASDRASAMEQVRTTAVGGQRAAVDGPFTKATWRKTTAPHKWRLRSRLVVAPPSGIGPG